jgi:hypothetical protein
MGVVIALLRVKETRANDPGTRMEGPKSTKRRHNRCLVERETDGYLPPSRADLLLHEGITITNN